MSERLVTSATALASGIVVGLIAAFVHRYRVDGIVVGLILGLVASAAAGIFTRAMGGRAATAWLAVGLAAIILLVRFVAPGGDRIILGDPLGTALTIGLPLTALALVLLPDSWFRPRV